jgi:hypothetical protein
MFAWGLFKPVATHAKSWVNDTVASNGQLWDVGYRFEAPPDRVVRFTRTRRRLMVGAAGSAVTLTMKAGCVIHRTTPTVVGRLNRTCGRGT